MTLDQRSAVDGLDDVVRAVPGVVALYSSAPAIVSTVRQLTTGASSATLVGATSTDAGYEVVANIGVTSDVQGPRTAEAVSAAILAALAGETVASVHVRISRILP